MASYALSSTVRMTVTFTVSGTVTDPTTITLTVKDPAGTSTPYTYAGSAVTKDSTGVYHKDLTLATAGTYTYAWVGTGACAAASEGEFFIKPTGV